MIPVLLTGPAGSGKTYRCLAEVASILRAEPEGPPLLFIAPRQATYQLERQLLAMPGVEGFSRLKILSFERLAQFVFEETNQSPPRILSEQGRIMALRAILGRRKETLRVYGKSAQRDGLAQEMSDLWRELCEHGVTPSRLRAAAEATKHGRLAAKLADFADIFGDYAEWLVARSLRDADEMLDLATEAARRGTLPEIAGLWLDGFAQMTPQERGLLHEVLRRSAYATLAFCLPQRPLKPEDGYSMWSVLTRTYCQIRDDLALVLGEAPREETLPRRETDGRFDAAPMLRHLEARWASPIPFAGACDSAQVRVVKCANLEAEAIFAAREIRKFIRAGGRYRETAVLVRSFDGSHDVLQRVLHRYGIKSFVDRREAVAHHPLAELTRGALRSIAFGFRHVDLFSAFKSGLIGEAAGEIDWFENMSLARGWMGDAWTRPLAMGKKASPAEQLRAERIHRETLKPIFKLEKDLGAKPSGAALATALRAFWEGLNVEAQLESWADEAHEGLHSSVWKQMNEWLESIELAFSAEAMPLGEWLAIIEAGFAALTVGLIPPSLDQTLIGSIDRSRNPDLKAVFLLGFNEGIFPRPGKERLLLNDHERDALAEAGCHLGTTSLWNLGAEQFYGYIACTRARESVTITFSETGPDGAPLNPSIFIGQLQRLFSLLKIETAPTNTPLDAESPHELNPVLFKAARFGQPNPLVEWPFLQDAWARARSSAVTEVEALPPEVALSLYGNPLRTSVSRLEAFARCPFQFFVRSGLRADERVLYELDRREQGSFQHEILAEFHNRLAAANRKWRDVAPAEGRALIAAIADELRENFQDGLANANAQNRFLARAKTGALQDFIEAYLALIRTTDYDPHRVELGFGAGGPLGAWRLQIDADRALEFSGRIDRVDVWTDPTAQVTHALVFDYKSSAKELERRYVASGIQQQLPAYLLALEKMGDTVQFPYSVRAAGAFYANLNPAIRTAKSRAEAVGDETLGLGEDLKHAGVFDWGMIDSLDPKRAAQMFTYGEGGPKAKPAAKYGALSSEDFRALLRETEDGLKKIGGEIYAGKVKIDPFRHGQKKACDQCQYAGVCRIDHWTHDFRVIP
jgi:ATP-dependent helicase/nuclease subunit B